MYIIDSARVHGPDLIAQIYLFALIQLYSISCLFWPELLHACIHMHAYIIMHPELEVKRVLHEIGN